MTFEAMFQSYKENLATLSILKSVTPIQLGLFPETQICAIKEQLFFNTDSIQVFHYKLWLHVKMKRTEQPLQTRENLGR